MRNNVSICTILAVCTVPVSACDLCAVYSATQAKGEIGRGFFAGIAEQFTYFGTVQQDGHKVSNPADQYMDSAISQVFVGYNFNERFGLQFNTPVIYRYYKRPDDEGGIQRGTVSGFGDVSLLGHFIPYQKLTEKMTLTWTILGGVKFPTGNTGRLKEEFNEVENPVGPPSGIHGHDLTLGSGSYDGIVGTGIYARWQRGFLSASLQYAIRSEGDYDYEFANDLTWIGGPGYYLVLGHECTLAAQAVVSGEYKGKDTFQGQTSEDTGMTAVYLGPQISITWRGNLSAQVGADFPVSLDNTAFQAVPDYRLRGGFSWHF